MAIDNIDNVSTRGPDAAGDKKSNQPPKRIVPFSPTSDKTAIDANGAAVKVRASEFLTRVSGLETTDRDRVLTGKVERDELPISAEVVTGLRNFTESYVRKLVLLRKDGVYDQMKRQQERGSDQADYLEDKYMLELFTDKQTGEAKKFGEIENLITEHPLILQNVMLVAERYARDTLAAYGLRAEMYRPGKRTELTDPRLERTIDLPVDQGALRSTYNRVRDWTQRRHEVGGRPDPNDPDSNLDYFLNHAGIPVGAGAIGVGTIGGVVGAVGALFGAGPGEVGGAIAGAAVGAGAVLGGLAVGRSFREGPRLRLVVDNEVRAQSQRGAERLRMERLIGVNPTNLTESTDSPAANDAIKIIYLRQMYLRNLDNSGEVFDAFSDQFITNGGTANRFEETRTVMGSRVNAEFQSLRDAYLRNHPDATPTQLRDFYRRAQETVLFRNFEEVSEKVRPEENIAGKLQTAIDARKPEGSAHVERTRVASEEKGRLTTEKQTLAASREALTGYEGKLLTIEKARQDLQRELAKINGGGLDYAHALQELRIAQSATGTTITITTDTGIETITDLHSDILAHSQGLANDLGNIRIPNPGEDTDAYRDFRSAEAAKIRLAHKPETDEDNRKTQLIISRITELTRLQGVIDEASRNLLQAEEIKAGGQEFVKFQEAFQRVDSLGLPGALLFTQTLEQNLADANNLFDMDPNFGWPESENNQMREVLRRATIQARANDAERADPILAPFENNFDEFRGLGLSTEQIALMSLDDLRARYVRTHPAATGTEADNAQRWALGQLRFLQASVNQEATVVDNSLRVQERFINGVDLTQEREQLEVVKDMWDKRKGIRARAVDGVLNNRAGLENTDHVQANTEGFTQAEADSQLPRNVLEVLNMITGYQDVDNADGRAEAFAKIWRNFGQNPPTADTLLLVRLRDAFEVPQAHANSFNELAAYLRTRFRNNRINSGNIAQYVGRNAVSQFTEWGRSLG